MVVKNDGNKAYSNAHLVIRKGDGTLVERRKVQISEGINEYLFNYQSDGSLQVFYYTVEVDGSALSTHRMVKRR